MNNFFKRTKMMEEAKAQGRKIFPAFELLIFMGIYMVSSFVQSFVYAFFASFYYYSDEKMLLIFQMEKPDFGAFIERFLELQSTIPEWLIILNIFLSFSLAVCAVIYCRFIDKRSIATLGLRKANVLTECVVGATAAFALIGAVAGIGVSIGVLKFNGKNGFSAVVLIFYVLSYAIWAFSNELLIRGYYLTAITKTATPAYALVSNGILSVLLYTMQYPVIELSPVVLIGVLNTFLFAICAGVYVIKRGNIWGVCGFSFIWNFSRFIIFGFNNSGVIETSSIFNFSNVKGFDIINGGVYGIDHGLLVTLVLFIAFGILLRVKENPNETVELSENENEEKSE